MGAKTIESTVAFKSNLQILNDYIDKDRNFLASIHDPFALAIMRERNIDAITTRQKEEYDAASLHCTYAFEDDYPWGTVIDNNGEAKVVCKCTNVSCSNFKTCRTDFDESELNVVKENEVIEIQKKNLLTDIIDVEQNHREIINHGDVDAAAALLASIKTDEDDAETDASLNEAVLKSEEQHYADDADDKEAGETEDAIKSINNMSKGTPASFDSFIDVEQSDIIEKDPEARTVVNAGPGTGKTWTLIEKIKYMLSEEAVEPENILVLCFSRAAVEVVRNRLAKAADNEELTLNWHAVEVRTFDSFATYLLAWVQENKPELLTRGFALEFADYERRIEESVKVIQKFTDVLAGYQHIIIDEVQDLVGIRAEMVLALLNTLPETCGFTILGDACQALYDYLAVDDKKIMDSEGFYKSIFTKYNSADFYSLTKNHRQEDELVSLTIPYREAILHGNDEARRAEAERLDDIIPVADVDLRNITAENVRRWRKNGTLGILTRTNGQALQISSWLRTAEVEHVLQKPAGSNELASWIARILTNTETDVIDKIEFSELFGKFYPEKENCIDEYWDALISTQMDVDNRHYEIENLLQGLLNNARNPLLFEEPIKLNTNITVSNIHRAKGREFDTVLVLDDVLGALAEEDCDDILEHKVCYVALTRPKKKIEKVHLKPQYIYVSKDESRRCFRGAGRPNKKYLSHFEVGNVTDINQRTVAVSDTIQQYIQKMREGTRLKLFKCSSETRPYVVYRIVPEDDEHTVLGYTTESFATCMKKAIQRVYNNYINLYAKCYPNIFTEVYFDGLTTCISASAHEIPGAKKIGEMYIWYGLSISGFAQIEIDRY